VCSKRLPNRLIKKSFRAYNTGNDEQNTGTKDLPFATLAKAVDAAADGAAIYIMSDLTMD